MLDINGLEGLSLVEVMEKRVEKTYIIFCNTDQSRWYSKYLKKGFQHCWVLYFDGFNWYKLEQTYNGSNMEMIFSLNGFEFIQCHNISRYYKNLRGYTVVEVDRDKLKEQCGDKLRSPFIVVGSTCVEYVKDFIAVRKWWCFTPYQLYKQIK